MVWNVFGCEAPCGSHTATKSESSPEAKEVDYEKNCTMLYRKIEATEWISVTSFLETGYWPGSFFADEMTPSEQARTWVTRFEREDRKKLRWSQLPLHLAIVVSAPFAIVRRLIELYPQSVRCTDDQNMLPLHLAMRHGSKDRIVDLLLAAFPEAVNAKGKHDRTPLDCAIHGDNAIRGRILNTFVERTKARATKVVVSQCSREVIQLKNKLKKKEVELNEVRSTLNTLDAARTQVEKELTETINALKASQNEMKENTTKQLKQLEESKEAEERELQVKIEQLESEKRDLQAARQSAKLEELEIRKALETVQMHVVESTPSDDVQSLKTEVQSLKTYRIQHSISQAEIEVDELTKQISTNEGDGVTHDDIENIQKAISDLKTSSTKIETDEDAKSMQAEIDTLRSTLLEKEDVSKIKMDLMRLKESLERDMKDPNHHLSESQIATIKATIAPVDAERFEEKSKDELKALKDELLKLSIKVCVEDGSNNKAASNLRTDAENEKREDAEVSYPVVSQVENLKEFNQSKGKEELEFTRASTLPAKQVKPLDSIDHPGQPSMGVKN